MNKTYLFHDSWGPRLSIQVNDNDYELEHIYFYDDEGVITGLDYFEDNRTFRFDGETRLRRKINLSRRENFIIKNYHSIRGRRYDLYIYHKNVDLRYDGKCVENSYYYDSDEVMFSHKYKRYILKDEIEGDYVHKEYIKSLSRKKDKLMVKANIILNELLGTSYHSIPEEELEQAFSKLRRVNRQLNRENKRLIYREQHNL